MKLFVSHMWEVWQTKLNNGEKPQAAWILGQRYHTHYIAPPIPWNHAP